MNKVSSFALCGNAGSGKDLAFTIIKFILYNEYNDSPKRPLTETELLMNLADTDWLLNSIKIRYDRFAEPIKTCLAGFLNINKSELVKNTIKLKLLPSGFYTQEKALVTIREAHQIIGDGLKQAFNIDIFALSLINRVNESSLPTAVLDLRYINEAAILKVNGIKIIKIVKDNQGQLLQHSSEQEISKIDADFVLHNDGHSVKNFTANILRMMREFGWISSKLSINDLIKDF